MGSRTLIFFMCLCVATWYTATAKRDATHVVTGICMRDIDEQTMTLYLSIDMKQDKHGEWRAIDANNGVVPTTSCNIDQTGRPAVTSVVNMDPATASPMGCGYSTKSDGQGVMTDYVWRVRYRECPEEKCETGGGKNKLYNVACPVDSATNEIKADITVSTPNLDQTITPKKPRKLLECINDETGAVVDTTTGIEVGKGYRLRATFDVSGLTPPRPMGLWVKKTILSSSDDFDTDVHEMISENGCRVDNIFSPAANFKLKDSLSSNAIFVHETGVALARKFESTDMVHFKSKIGACFISDELECSDPCVASNSARRRRRDVTEEEEEEEIVVSIRIYDPSEAKTEASTGMDSGVLIGVCVAGGIVLLLLILATCFILTSMRRRKRRSNQAKVPPEGFENKVNIPY